MSKLYTRVVFILVALSIVACQPLQALEPMAAISGGYYSLESDQAATPREYFGNVNVNILDPATHRAEGTITYNVYDSEMETWDGVEATAHYAVFDAVQNRAVIVAQIDKAIGNVDGVPGEFACFWVKNDVEGDQFGMHYYTHFYSDEPGVIRSKIFWPADSQFLGSEEAAAMAVRTDLYGDEWNSDFFSAMQETVPSCVGGNCFEVDGMAEADPSMIIDIARGDIAFVPAS